MSSGNKKTKRKILSKKVNFKECRWNETSVGFKYEKISVAEVCSKYVTPKIFESVSEYVKSHLYKTKCARDSFRASLLTYLTMGDSEASEDNKLVDEVPTTIRLNGYEKFLLRYNYCVYNAISTSYITPLDYNVIDRILKRLNTKLKTEHSELINCIVGQIKNDYIVSMKKTTIDFVLDEGSLNPGKVYTLPIKEVECSEEWKKSYADNKYRLKHLLHITNPCLVQIHSFWQKTYRDFVLVSSKTLSKATSAQEVSDYHQICQKNFNDNLKKILDEYYRNILKIICIVNRNKMVPSKEQPKRRKHFYSCIDTLMTLQMQQLIVNSMTSYTNLLVQPASVANEHGLSGFVLRFIFEKQSLGLEPSWPDFQQVIFYVFDLLKKASKIFPKVEKLLQQPVLDMKILTADDYLRPVIFDSFVESCKNKILEILEKERQAVMGHAMMFNKYSPIITGEALNEVKAFLKQEDLTYERIGNEVLKYDSLCYDISTTIPPVIFSGLFEIHCEVLCRNLVKKNEELINILLDKMISGHNASCKRVGIEYSTVVNNLKIDPTTTKELMSLIEMANEVREFTAPKLLLKLQDCHESLVFLLDHGSISVQDMKLNVETFLWKDKLEFELDRRQNLIEETKKYLQAALMMKKSSLKNRLEVFDQEINQLKYLENLENFSAYYETVSRLNQGTVEITNEIEAFWNEELAYGWPTTAMPLKAQVINNLKPFLQFFELIKNYEDKLERWMNGPREGVIPDTVDQESDTFLKMFFKLEKTFADYPGLKQMAITMKHKVEEFRNNLPLVGALFHPGMNEAKFWDKIFEITQVTFDYTQLTLSSAIQMNLETFIPKFEPIAETASKEYSLKQLLARMKEEWISVAFTVVLFKETGTFVISSVEDIQILLEDHILKTQTMKFSFYIEPILEETNAWFDAITLLNSIIEEWLRVQATWMYLEPIFSSPEIVNQMMEESRKFSSVDRMWREFMQKVNENPLAMEVVKIEKIYSKLQKSNDILEIVQKSINNYLEIKRLYFPRFFFLSNDELLDIISETKDPKRVQPHLKKCFEGINSLRFEEESLDILSMISSEGELIQLKKKVSTADARGSVEKWLLDLEKMMILSLKNIVRKALKAYYNTPRGVWVKSWPGQSVLCVTQKIWTASVHDSIKEGKKAMEDYLQVNNKQIEEVVKIVRGELSLQNRITLQALIVLDVHARDIVAQLSSSRVETDDDFQWLCQLRYYWENKLMNTRMVNCELKYGYEYLGNSPRLVITSLTDRCYRTLFGALHLNLGGAPEGPAGTGKTETTKDLAKAVAKQCIVFNCSDGLDYIALGKFFKGLASCGAWSCFDEFNRIDLEVLSVVAQQILTIQQAIKSSFTSLEFEGTVIGLDRTCSVFITMNPGYAGRSELPDNLKALFRPVAMMVPDYAMISEISLYSCGFIEARPLAIKVVATYRLCSEQLSYQSHYDYGMRAVKSVLTAASNLKLKRPDENEDILMLQSIIDVNLPKFLVHDLPLFNSITVDLFPGVSLPETDYECFNNTMKRVCDEFGLQCTPYFQEITHRIYEMMIVRHGFMIVGDSFAGKTSAFKVTAQTLCILEKENLMAEFCTKYKVINPKSITLGQLYGNFDPNSHEWCDGVLATSFREMASSTTTDRQWLIFDGPIDAVWIESMNTVLDDNKKLCLMSGEIIQMSPKMNLIFETLDLSMASPATVSRCGMIYMTPDVLGWRPLLDSWLKTLPTFFSDVLKTFITSLFNYYVDPVLTFIKSDLKEVVQSNKSNLVNSLMRLMQSLMDELFDINYSKLYKDNTKKIQIEFIFIFSLVWSLGCTCTSQSQEKFDVFLRRLMEKQKLEDRKLSHKKDSENEVHNIIFPLFAAKKSSFSEDTLTLSLEDPQKRHSDQPPATSVYDYFIDKERKNRWDEWRKKTKEGSDFGRDCVFNDLIVPTVDTVRATALLDMLINHKFPVLFVGPSGSGKSVVSKNYMLTSMNKALFVPNNVTFSSQVTSLQVQTLIISKMQKKGKGRYGGPKGKSLVFLIDDLHMPTVEQFGAQPPIELLRQLMDQKNWYDFTDTSTIYLTDINFVGCITNDGASKIPVTQRFLRHFNIICLNDYSYTSLKRIFGVIFNWHLNSKNFPDSYRPISDKIVEATLQVFNNSTKHLLATPSKSHYKFNLWDVSRVVQGVTLCYPMVFDGPDDMAVLWVHEVLRVFGDRLLDDNDRKWLLKELRNQVNFTLDLNFDLLFQNYKTMNNSKLSSDSFGFDTQSFSELIFCNFSSDPTTTTSEVAKLYRKEENYQQMVKNVETSLEDYNDFSKKPLDMIIFRYTIEHVARTARVLMQPGGHVLMVGLGGTGRHSLARLATHMMDYELFEVDITRGYGLAEWQEDLKNMLKKTALNDMPGVFLFSDIQLKMEIFLEAICNLLSSGDASNIFDAEEKAEICERMRKIDRSLDRSKQTDGSMMALFNMFVNKCKNLLHIIFLMSPIGDVFRERLRKFPTLINCCTIDWYHEWDSEALETVATKFLQPLNLQKKLVKNCVETCVEFHESSKKLAVKFVDELSRITYITSSAYLELINTFKLIYQNKKDEIKSLSNKYETGLEKLASAQSQVAVMQKELTDLQPLLVIASDEVEKVMADIERDSKEVYIVEKNVKVDEIEANQKATEASKIKEECDAELADAMVIMNAANAALNTLTSNDISIVKTMKNPPAGVKLIMEAVCVLKGVKPEKSVDKDGKKFDDFWKPSLRLLADNKFLESLINFDKDNVPAPIMKQIRAKYSNNSDFDPEKIKVVSSACEGLCRWILAIEKYDVVAKIVAPKKLAMNEAQKIYEKAMQTLAVKQKSLNDVRQKLAKLKMILEENEKKKMELKKQVELCSIKLVRAEKLIGGLGSEQERWESLVKYFSNAFITFTGNCLLAAAFITYLGPFTSAFRTEAVDNWFETCKKNNIKCTDSFTLLSFVGDPVVIRMWNIAGLPNDSFSIDNGIILQTSRRWPLMIDPQEQANKFIRNLEGPNKLQVVKLTDSSFYNKLENSIRFGNPLLLENVREELDSVLEPVLLKQTVVHGGITVMMLGDTAVEYNKTFKLYITTKLSNPHYMPELSVNVTLLNFMITKEGLDDQLLGIVVAKERPELEASRNALVIQSADNKKKLKEIETMILEVLSKSEGNILDDESAIKVLSSSKVLSKEITQKEVVAEETQAGLNQARKVYEPLSYYCRVLFFTIVELSHIDPMYQNSLKWFIDLFANSIDKAPKGSTLAERLETLKNHFTYSLYVKTCKSLFEKDKLLFSFLLFANIQKEENIIANDEWSFFLKGAVGVTDIGEKSIDWMPNAAWEELFKFNTLGSFKGILKKFKKAQNEWKNIYDSQEPHKTTFPEGFKDMKGIKKLIMLKILRPDKVIPAVADVISEGLGPQFIEIPPFDLGESYSDSNNLSPLIFILSPGSDPIAALIKFAQSLQMVGSKFQSLSLGQGQGPIAEKMLNEGMEHGYWVVLQNCHLAPSWMPQLEKICQELDPKTVHPSFRLWLTSYPSSVFPVSILQSGVKITNEPPKGLRFNVLRSFASDPLSDLDFFNGVAKQNIWKSMVFSLCFLHACIQERTKFGAIGWNIPYGFNETDLKISVDQLAEFLNKYDTVQFEALRYLTGECNYGGRVTDDWDRRTLRTLVEKFYCPQVLSRANDVGSGDYYYLDPESKFYYIPDPKEYDEYLEYIKELPYNTEPSVFGMHSNVNITKEVNETKTLLSDLIIANMRTGKATKGLESIVKGICEDISSKLPEKIFDLTFARDKYPTAYKQSMNTVLVQELSRFNELLLVIKSSIRSVTMAIKGLILMGPDLQAMFFSISINKVPDLWMRKSYPSLKPLSFYITDLINRLAFFEKWLNEDIPTTFWMSGFFFVQAFLTGVQQNYARKYTIPIDLLTFDFQVMPSSFYEKTPQNGEFVNGLFLDGARWDEMNNVLAESLPKILFCAMPAILLIPCKRSDLTDSPTYIAPVYNTSERRGVLSTTGHSTNFIIAMRLPSEHPSQHWILRGVALLCQLDQ